MGFAMKPLFKFFKIISVISKILYLSLRILFRPEDIQSILKLGDLTTDTEGFKLYLSKALKDPEAYQLIEQRYSKGGFKMDELAKAPEGSLGAALYKHMTDFKLDPYHIAIQPGYSQGIYLRERQREIHDILHSVYGLGIDVKDEAQLNAIVMAQVFSPIATLIVAGSLIHTLFKTPSDLPALFEAIVNGFQQGKASKNVFSVKWEELMDQPLSLVRQSIRL